MKLFQLLFVYIAIASCCGDPQHHPVPGASETFSFGYDAKIEIFRKPVLDHFHYEYGQNWRNPYSKVLYDVPDELYLTALSRNKVETNLDTYSNWEKYLQDMKGFYNSRGLVINGKDDSQYAFQKHEHEINNLLKNGTNQLSIERRTLPMYQLTIYPDPPMSPQFVSDVESLPSHQDDTIYRDFILKYGTHFFTSCQLGGFLNITVVFESSLFQNHTGNWVNEQALLSITWGEIHLQINPSRNRTTEKVDKDFEKYSKVIIDSVGGDREVLLKEGYAAWLYTVYSNPAVLPTFLQIQPLTTLVEDKERKELLGKALNDYFQDE
eukprot:GCRY01000294.1.p1 GENE.GCRY01000294.1~~GCRY01000294.1.p1  ORF type:complete len:323 (-),score=26.37 GCRY01000294.1:1034-2002(-)